MPELPRGVFAAVPTFFHDDESLDLDAFAAHLRRLAGTGLCGVLVCGSTGEFPALDSGERMDVAAAAVAALRGTPLQVVIHAGAASTRDTVALARHAVSIGAHGVAAITPYYLPVDAAALALHLRRVKDAVGSLPLLAYSFPARAAVAYPVEVLSALAADGVVSGVKESGPDLRRLLDIRQRCGDSFRVYAGAAELLAAATAHGMDGGVLALANAAPGELSQVHACACDGDMPGAVAIFERLRGVGEAASIGLMPAGLKAVLAVQHGAPAAVRGPRMALDAAQLSRVAALLESASPGD